MADPTVLTAIIGTAAGVLGAVTPVIIERRHRRDEQRDRDAGTAEGLATATVANWTALTNALQAEVTRLHADVDRISAEHQAALDRQRADYETQLAGARQQIAELRAEVAALRRLLRPDAPS